MIGLANVTSRTLKMTDTTRIKAIAVLRMRLASAGFSSPRRLATRAETATLAAKNTDKPTNLGCVVRPTAATA